MSITTLVAHLVIGAVSAFAFVIIARRSGTNGEKEIYAAGLFIAALIYVGFATIGGASFGWSVIELAGLVVFTLLAVLGLKLSIWLLAAGWALHCLWDALLHLTRHAAFVPDWYPVICLGFDLILAAYIVARFKAPGHSR
jgi:hypothetical protein